MNTKRNLIQICLLLTAVSAHAQFQWSEGIASANNWPEGEPNTGLALDTNDNCYMAGFFDDTNNFGGVTLTNQSTGGSDIFVAKYNSTGVLLWVQQAGESAGNINYGRGIGVDTNGNIYVTGGYQGPAKFGGVNLPSTSGEQFFLAKYNSAGSVQWVQSSTGGNGDNNGIGLTVDGAGNSYALAVMDYSGTSITFGTKTVTAVKGGTTFLILVKYDNTGTVQWAQLFDTSMETFGSKVAVDAAGNVYVRGLLESDMTIGGSNLTVSAGAAENMFIAKFNSSGTLLWVQQPQGDSNTGEGGVAVDPAGNVFISGAFTTNLNFGGGIILTNGANASAPFGDAFLAKYNSSGAIQWAQSAGGTNGGFYWDLGLDAQTNIYTAGIWGLNAAIAKYSPAGTFQWVYSASGPTGSPVSSGTSKCAVDASGHCYLNGFYQGTATFGTNTLQPQETWNFFLAETATNPTVQFTASPTVGALPLMVQFNSTNVDSQGNTITSWNWNFGDGGTSASQNPSHTYTNAGTFNPNFIATNNHNVAVAGYGPPITVLTPTASTNFTFTTNSGSITITGYTGTNAVVTIPNIINGLPVTSIGYPAFYENTIITSVMIPNSVTIIGNYAFEECTSLSSVTIGTNVTSIGFGAFEVCASLTSVTIPASVINIGEEPFAACTSLTAITVNTNNPAYSSVNGVLFDKAQTTLIQYPAGNAGPSYIIPSSVTSIGQGAFDDCTSLTNITIPASVTSIAYWVFLDCSSLISVTIPNSVTNIGWGAFDSCSSLTSVTIGTNITSIGDYTFEDCSSLTSVTIPASVTSIGEEAFYSCGLASVAIPNNVTSIGAGAFGDCFELTSVIIPNSVTSIGGDAFSGCKGLSSITIPNSVTNIGDAAFFGCPLSSVTIPSSVVSMGEFAFEFCTSLTSVTIQNSVTSIGDDAFENCPNLIAVYIRGNAPGIDSTVFSGDSDLIVYYLPGTVGWSEFTANTGISTSLWYLPNPLILNNGPNFGVQTNRFGFTISWATNISVVVQACTNLANSVWQPVATNTLTGGTNYFSDPQWTNYPKRFYRILSP